MYEASRSTPLKAYEHRNSSRQATAGTGTGTGTASSATGHVAIQGGPTTAAATARSRERSYLDHTSSTAGRARSATLSSRQRLLQHEDDDHDHHHAHRRDDRHNIHHDAVDNDSSVRVGSARAGSARNKSSARHMVANSSRTLLTANMTHTRYDIVRKSAERNGFTLTNSDDCNAYLLWNDSYIANERICELKVYQRINHFPGMGELCRKDYLARNFSKMKKVFPTEFGFFPKTWVLPHEYQSFCKHARGKSSPAGGAGATSRWPKTFILKPANGAMGNGISLHRGCEQISSQDHCVVQEYLEKPHLVDGYKCDMRVYALVTSCDPLNVFVYREGLLRMATEKYSRPAESNLQRLYMHLTNYSVNKHNHDYLKSYDCDTGSKRSLQSFLTSLAREQNLNVETLWRSIEDVVIKTIIVGQPHLLHAYRMCRPGQSPSTPCVCFEILGFDIMLDENLKPWLIEVNRSPSFSTDEKIDKEVKSGLLDETISLLNIKTSDKRKNMAVEKAITQKRLLRANRKSTNFSETYEKERNFKANLRKIEQLKDQLAKIQRVRDAEIYENRKVKKFKRVFPPPSQVLLHSNKNNDDEKYTRMLIASFGLILTGKMNSMQKEMERIYRSIYTEEDVLEQLKACEQLAHRGEWSKVNQHGMAVCVQRPTSAVECSVKHSPCSSSSSSAPYANGGPGAGAGAAGGCSRLSSYPGIDYVSPASPAYAQRRSFTADHHQSFTPDTDYYNCDSETSSESCTNQANTMKILNSLNAMKMKFPGKCEQETEYILDMLNKDWTKHKSKIASYWLVKLDTSKRKKIINIVKSSVRGVMDQCWKPHNNDLQSSRLFRYFVRIFNRMLWQHGHGLWNCFQQTGNSKTSSWQSMLTKCSDKLTSEELACCERVVQLCRDCLLIVYQYITISQNKTNIQAKTSNKTCCTNSYDWSGENGNQLMSKRMIRLYQNN